MIVTKDLRKVYGGACAVEAVRGVSMEVADGEFLAIVGPSGSGKSTLMNLLGCLDRATDGYYALDGQDVTRLDRDGLAGVRSRKIGFVFQNFNLLPRMTAEENVALPLVYWGVPLPERRERARQALDRVGLYHRREHLPGEMSGGQQQRTAIGRAVVKNPDILLCDEPTGALDYHTSKEILKLIETVNRKYGNTIIMVTHNDAIKDMADRVVRLRDGTIMKNYANEHRVPAEKLEW